MPIPSFTSPPPAPNRNAPSTFRERMDAFLAWIVVAWDELATFVSWADSTATDVSDAAAAAAASASAADDSASDAADQVVLAAAQVALAAAEKTAAAVSAASAVGAPGTNATCDDDLALSAGSKAFTLDQTGKQYALGQYLLFASAANSANQMTGRLSAFNSGTGAGTIEVNADDVGGSGNHADWVVSLAPRPANAGVVVGVVEITGNLTLDGTHENKLILVTSGSPTITLLAAGVAGVGFTWRIKNIGGGVATIDPNGSETIDDRTTIKVYQEDFEITSDGDEWYTHGRPKEVVISTAVVGSAVASVDFEAGFGDPELAEMVLIGEAVTVASGGALGFRLKQGGAYGTSGYSTKDGAGTTIRGADVDQVQLTKTNQTVVSFNASLIGPNSTTNGIAFTAWSEGVIGLGSATAAALQGVRVRWNSGDITGGTLTFKGRRK